MANSDNPKAITEAEFLHIFLNTCTNNLDNWINENGVDWARRRLLELTNLMLSDTNYDSEEKPLADQDVAPLRLGGICPSTCANCRTKLMSGVYTQAQYDQCINCPCTGP